MAIIQRFSTIRRGGIVFTGNTAGLSPVNASGGQFAGSIAVFTSLDTALQVPGYPAGTTLSYAQNGSAATLSLPAGATVIRAELIWGGLFRTPTQDLSAITDNPVTFSTPTETVSLTGDPLTRNNLLIPANGGILGFYTRTADVTSRVAASGVYSVRAIPALISTPSSQSSDTNHAGWTLAVVYEDPSLPLRSLTLWCGASAVSLDAGSTDIAVAGFLTPDSLPISGRLFVSAQEGDAVIGGDSLLFGANAGSLQALSGPNNPANNFFASQINNSSGLLDTSGTFGTRNANAAAGVNTSACRQGWDITAADVSPQLAPAQNSALIRLTTTGDLYVANAVALQVDSKGADIGTVKSADRAFVFTGGEAEYTVEVTNSGTTAATDVTVIDPTPAGLDFVEGSLTVDGVSVPGGFPVNVADIPAGGSRTLTYRLRAASVPAVNPAVNTARVNYEFSPFAGVVVGATDLSDPVELEVVLASVSVVKSVDKQFAARGEELTYTSVIANTGNTPLANVVFRDEIPDGTTFVPDSVSVNGAPAPGASPADGVPLGALATGGAASVTFKVTINQGGNEMIIYNDSRVDYTYELPDGSTASGSGVSNTVQTENLTDAVLKVKSTDRLFAREGDTAKQTITLTNNSSTTLTDLFLADFMSDGATYTSGTVTVNGVPHPEHDMGTGFALADLAPSESVTIVYDILVGAITAAAQVTNDAKLNYSVTDPGRGKVPFEGRTNLVTIPVVADSVSVVKSVDKAFALAGEELTYTSVVTNTGTLEQTALTFRDAIPSGTTFVPGSVTVNGTAQPSYDPAAGFPIGTLSPGASATVVFKVRIN